MRRTGAAACFVLTCVVSVASVPISVGREPAYDVLLYPVNAIALGLSGALIVTYRRSNPTGWVLSVMGLVAAFVEFTEGYGYHATWPAAATSEWLTNWTNYLGISGTAILVLLFPSGRDLSRIRRAGVWVASLATGLQMLGAALGHASDPAFASGVNPHAIDGLEPVYFVGQVLFLGCLLAAIGSVIVRFRRSTGVEHQQLKWVAYALALLAVIGSLATFLYNDSALVRVAIALVVPLLPAAICVAILRYRLFDIDLIINRTLVYGVLTVLLGGAYLATVLVLGAVLGRGSSWATAGATLAVAVAFRPLRGRVQDLVDRRFRRARFEALARVDAFLDALRTGRAEPEALEQLLRDVMARPDLELRYLPPGAEHPAADGELLVERAGVSLAVVAHADGMSGSARLLDEVVARAGLAIEIARLRAEVRHQLAAVEASRARIVAAGYEERRRLERDLHDGAQQRLVSIGLTLRHAQFELGGSPAIDVAVEQLGVAISELRELANGIRPAYLDDGLDIALRELAERMPLRVDVHVDGARYASDIEATAYFVACEALANTVKHAGATGVALRAERKDGHLVLTVSDDGTGGARPAEGTGLRGLADRISAQGGRMRVESPPEQGTTVIAELPCAS
ncbi:histidine kinase [Cryptosporangium sp. NPDC051539]|uniref:histidine kinase n=1 Tax=Cryptosporangium sp. NPDC051539 TaxID=3363962 RepID=UPI0037917877